MKSARWPLSALVLCCLFTRSAWALSPTFGNLNVVQNDAGNTASSVTITLPYVQSSLSVDGVTSLGTLQLRTGSNRGDYNVRMTATPSQDRAQGILITNVSQNGRDNNAFGDTAGLRFATSAISSDANGYFIPQHNLSGTEWNTNVAAAWFPYADGWIGGHAVATASGQPLSSVAGSAGLSVSATGVGSNVIYDDPATAGIYELRLDTINSQTDGILAVVGGANGDNYALSRANADGSWTVYVKDNGSDASIYENDGFGFVFVPTTAAVTGNQPGVHALGRLNGNLTRDITAGDYVVVRSSTGIYQLYAPGIDPAQSTLLLSPEAAGVGGDNIWTYEPGTKGWTMQYRDLPGAGLQDNGAGDDTLSFLLMASGNTAAIWDAGGANANWGTAGNWQNDALPLTGKDVVIGTGTGNVTLDGPQTAGMLMISREAGFTLAGTSTLTLKTGLLVGSKPSASQTYIVSTPIVLEEDGFLIAQSTGSAITLRLDVASGNALTADNKNLTFGGSNLIELRDPISLGTGKFIKEGSGQVTLTTANSIGGVEIITGPNSSTNGAFRLNAPAAYGAFGSNDLVLKNLSGVTALYFDNAAGSGTLSNNLVLQSVNASSGTRILVDSAAAFNVTLSGQITGGNATSEFIVDNDAAGGQGRLHLTNLANDFTAQRVNVNRGALVVHGDGVLGHANNSLYLNTGVTDGSVTSGLHFGADNVTLAATRAVTLNTTSPIHTGTYTSTITGTVTGAGGLIKGGTGTLILTGTNSYQGTTNIKQGTLQLSPSSGSAAGLGALMVENQATLSGHGDLSGAVSLLSGARLTPGLVNQSGAFQMLNGLDLQSGSRVLFDLLGNGQNDRLNVAAGTLQISNGSAFEVLLGYTPSAGDSFDLLDWTTLTGTPTLEDLLILPNLNDPNLRWDSTQFNTLGILSIQAVPEPTRLMLLLIGSLTFLIRRQRRGV